jgi:hypothetical protein
MCAAGFVLACCTDNVTFTDLIDQAAQRQRHRLWLFLCSLIGKVPLFICDSTIGLCSDAAPELKSSFLMRPRWSFSLLLAVNAASKLASISVPTAGNRSSSWKRKNDHYIYSSHLRAYQMPGSHGKAS